MIQEFVNRFMAGKSALEEMFSKEHPDDYLPIVEAVIRIVSTEAGPDPEKIHVIDDGEYQGTLLYVMPNKGYQPSRYWYVFVDYGSCSGCDTLEGITNYSNKPPTPQQVANYMSLALHIVQGLKEME